MLMNIDICKKMMSNWTFKFALPPFCSFFYFIYFYYLQKPVEFSPVHKHGAEYGFVIFKLSEIFVIMCMLKSLLHLRANHLLFPM